MLAAYLMTDRIHIYGLDFIFPALQDLSRSLVVLIIPVLIVSIYLPYDCGIPRDLL